MAMRPCLSSAALYLILSGRERGRERGYYQGEGGVNMTKRAKEEDYRDKEVKGCAMSEEGAQ